MKILSIEKMDDDLITGFIEKLGGYIRYVITPDNTISLKDKYGVARYRDYNHFCGVMGKFDPYTFFLKKPYEVEKLDYKKLIELHDQLSDMD